MKLRENKGFCIVIIPTNIKSGIIVDSKGEYLNLTNYNMNFKCEYKEFTEFDIIEIYKPPRNSKMLDFNSAGALLWKEQKDETIEMTIEEIEQKLGHKIKIINNKGE